MALRACPPDHTDADAWNDAGTSRRGLGSFMTFSGFGMFLFPILVGVIRDSTGSFFPGFVICAAASWTLMMAGVLMPRNAVAFSPTPEPQPAQD